MEILLNNCDNFRRRRRLSSSSVVRSVVVLLLLLLLCPVLRPSVPSSVPVRLTVRPSTPSSSSSSVRPSRPSLVVVRRPSAIVVAQLEIQGRPLLGSGSIFWWGSTVAAC